MENAGTLPNFLVIGAAKCGTTSLCALLGRHPEVFLHPRKELDFFSYDGVYAKGIEWYASRFRDGAGRKAVGEGSPNYAKRRKNPRAAERIARHLPDARLLYIVRHPLRRMESAWLHARRAGHRSAGSFGETVRTFPEYVDTSDYEAQLEAFAAYRDRGRLRVLFFEEFRSAPGDVLREAFRFLGVDDSVEVPADDSPTNPSLGRRVDAPFLKRLRKTRAFRSVERVAPALTAALVRPLQRELTERPTWDEETLRFVRDALETPTRRFLEAHGRPADLWDLSGRPDDPGGGKKGAGLPPTLPPGAR
ncbi:MAG: sulfotransferase family protein [Planctomycetota bacterium JB042]